MKPRDPVQAVAKYLSATIEINGNPCGCSNKMVNYYIFLTITQMQFFVVEREVIVANLRKTKLLSLCVLDVIHVVCIQHTLVALYYENIKYKT